LKKNIGKIALFISGLATIWLLLGMFNIVPLLILIPGETFIRSHASFAVIFLLVASWAFWNND
jgi:hypothetical protein